MNKRKANIILVATITDNSVNEAKVFSSIKKAERVFIDTALGLGAKYIDIGDHLDDGYYTDGCNTVCIMHPDVIGIP